MHSVRPRTMQTPDRCISKLFHPGAPRVRKYLQSIALATYVTQTGRLLATLSAASSYRLCRRTFLQTRDRLCLNYPDRMKFLIVHWSVLYGWIHAYSKAFLTTDGANRRC